MLFTSPPEKSRIAVSQIYSLPRHSVIASSFLTRAGAGAKIGLMEKLLSSEKMFNWKAI